MANMSLEELRNRNVIDTTVGKVTTPAEGKKTLAESDPAFMPSGQDYKGGPKRTPVIDAEQNTMPKINIVNASFDSNSAKSFDINTLEKRPKKENPIEQEMMSDLDEAVEREKRSITERIHAITEKQYEEYIEGTTKEDVERYIEENESSDNEDTINIDSNGNSSNSDKTNVNKKIIIPDSNEFESDESNNTFVDDRSSDVRIIQKSQEVFEDSDEDIDSDLGDYARDNIFNESNDNQNGDSNDNNYRDNAVSNLNDIDEDLDKELDGEKISDEDIFNNFKESIKEKISPIKKKINLKNFKINSKPISPSKIHMTISDISVADYVLPNANRVITMSALSGPEMLRMNPERSSRNRINTLREIYNILYRHVESAKPSTFDEWLKTVRFSDLDHIYFCAYKATFSGSNFMNYECGNEKCRHAFIEDKSFDDLIVYDNDEIKEKMQNLLRSGNDSIPENEIVLNQISDNFVVGLRNPTIYNVVMETATLSESFLEKYEELIDVIAYIDSVYMIDEETQSLNLIDMKYDEKDIAKSTARRIKIIADILKTLSSDSYYELRYNITNTFPNINSIHYRIPGTKCPKCGREIDAIPLEAQQLLFMRHQLGAFAAL